MDKKVEGLSLKLPVDQSLCDRDVVELVSDTVELTTSQVVATQLASPPVNSRLRVNAILPIFGIVYGLILGIALFLVYNAFSNRIPSQNTNLSLLKSAAGLQSPPNPVPATPVVSAPPSTVKSSKTGAKANRLSTVVKPSPKPSRPQVPRQEERTLKPESVSRKKESKLVSILKKTGRMLKRPFKF